MKKSEPVKLAVLAILLAISYVPTFIWMYSRWNARDTYYSHGFLIPFISGFIIWQKRKTLKDIALARSSIGWLFFIPGLLLHGISTLWKIGFSSGFALIPVLIGMVLLLGGKNYLRQLMFPILFLLFMVPMPEVAIANASFRLKLFAAQISTFIINSVGVKAVREGSLIITANARTMVEDPCSGIRSLIALIALGTLMAYYSNLSKTKKTILFASSIPIAISTNVIRIVALTLVSEIYGEKYATGIFHDAMGILVFVFAFFGLTLIAKLLE